MSVCSAPLVSGQYPLGWVLGGNMVQSAEEQNRLYKYNGSEKMNYFCPFKQRWSLFSLVGAITESTEQRYMRAPSCETESAGEEY